MNTLFSVVLLACIAGVESQMWSNAFELSKAQGSAVLDQVLRAKRSTNGHHCLASCVQGMVNGFENNLQIQTMISQQVNAVQAKEFCTEYKNSKQCFDSCSSPLKKLVLKAFRPIDYICIEHYPELLANIPCYEQSNKAAEEACIPVCGGMNEVNNVVDKMESAQQTLNVPQIVKQFEALCGFLECHTKCQGPVLEKKCNDPKPAKFMQEFVKFSVQNFHDLLQETKMHSLFPQACNRLIDPEAAKPQKLAKLPEPAIMNSYVKKADSAPESAAIKQSPQNSANTSLASLTLVWLVSLLLSKL